MSFKMLKKLFFVLFLFFALQLWGMEFRLMWGKSNLKQFNIRQEQNKM